MFIEHTMTACYLVSTYHSFALFDGNSSCRTQIEALAEVTWTVSWLSKLAVLHNMQKVWVLPPEVRTTGP